MVRHRKAFHPAPSVAGVRLPAFVERRRSRRSPGRGGVSPGLDSRPSLSDRHAGRARGRAGGVAGVRLPAFVERPVSGCPNAGCTRWVSPGLDSRPSLSAADRGPAPERTKVSPGLDSRPSLSGEAGHQGPGRAEGRVAGVRLPAFVERCRRTRARPTAGRVAGVRLPAFVERSPPGPTRSPPTRVSPGLDSRPSLSAWPLRRRW